MARKAKPTPAPAPAPPAPTPPAGDAIAALVQRVKYRDPDVLGVDLARLRAELLPNLADRRLGLGLDLGTNCGYALSWFRPGEPYDPATAITIMGQLDLSTGPYDSGGIRLLRFRTFLEIARPDVLFYEDVKYTPAEVPNRINARSIVARAATPIEWFGALKGTLAAWAEERGVPAQGYPIGTIKRRASGKGNAGKPEVIAGVNALFGVDLDPDRFEATGDDNVADAATVLLLGLEDYARGVAPGSQRDDNQDSLPCVTETPTVLPP